jgi:hypothetical protein
MKRIVRLTESDLTRIVRRVINEGATVAQTAKNLYDAKGGMFGNDKEAQVVSELMSIKDYNQLNAVSKELAKLNGGLAINQFLATFMEGDELQTPTHKGKSVFSELARIYGIEINTQKSPFNLYNNKTTVKDKLKTGFRAPWSSGI